MTVQTARAIVLFCLAMASAGGLAFWLWKQWKSGFPKPHIFQRNGYLVGSYLILAVVVWVVFLIILPQIFMVELSFRPNLPPAKIGSPVDIYTLENYREFLFSDGTWASGWNSIHLRSYFMTIMFAVLITALSLMVCYPVAYFISKVVSPAMLPRLLSLIIIPYWINDILRAFAFRIMFSSGGLFNQALTSLGIVDAPIDFIGNNVALLAGLTYAYVLFMLFPLYNSLQEVDTSHIEAARDLGAPWWHIHAFVVIPEAKSGIASGCTLVFMLSAGALSIPQILAGPSALWFTPVVYDRFYQLFNWPQGAAYAFALLSGCILIVLTALRLMRMNLGEVVK